MKAAIALLAMVACVSAAPGFLGGPVYAPAIYHAAPVVKHIHPVHAVYSPPIIHKTVVASPVIHKTVFAAPVVKTFGPIGYGGPVYGHGFGYGHGYGYGGYGLHGHGYGLHGHGHFF